MTPELQAELDRIENFLIGPQGHALASILSALRGPDEGDYNLKAATTTHIRSAAFPRLKDRVEWGHSVGWDMDTSSHFDTNHPYIGRTHFKSHVEAAARLLGLMH